MNFTNRTKKEIVKRLFLKDQDLFFDQVNSWSHDEEANVYIHKCPKLFHYELKEEFKSSINDLSILEVIQLTESNHLDIKKIRGWVSFLGIVVIVQIILGLIVGLSYIF